MWSNKLLMAMLSLKILRTSLQNQFLVCIQFCQSILVIDQILESILKVKSCKNKFFRTYSWNVPAGTKSTTFATGLLLCFIHLKGWRQKVSVRGGVPHFSWLPPSLSPIWPSPCPPPSLLPTCIYYSSQGTAASKAKLLPEWAFFYEIFNKSSFPLGTIHKILIHTVTRQ